MALPTLTRRRYPERPDCWHIYYGDVHAGTIAKRVGNPFGGLELRILSRQPPKERMRPARQPPLKMPAPTSSAQGQSFCRSEPRPTFRNGAMAATGTSE